MVKAYIKQLLLITALICLGVQPLSAEVLRSFQILLPGNICGNLITFNENQKAEGTEAFKLPYVVNAFLKQKDKDSLIFAIGNDSDMFKSFSYLNKGKAEREIIKKCHPMAGALSPNDLEVYNESYLDYDIKNRVFTNVEAPDNTEIFQRCYLTKQNNSNIYFFNFITPEYCEKLALNRWSQIRVDNPARALRKINPDLTAKDFTISVVYGDLATINELTDEFKRLKGIHFIINVPINGEGKA